MANQAMRAVGFAYKDITMEQYLDMDHQREYIEREMTFISVFGIRDMIRDEVPSAINTVKRAGVNVIMCTGDNILTARQIARESNILTDMNKQYACMNGSDFREAIGGLH